MNLAWSLEIGGVSLPCLGENVKQSSVMRQFSLQSHWIMRERESRLDDAPVVAHTHLCTIGRRNHMSLESIM